MHASNQERNGHHRREGLSVVLMRGRKPASCQVAPHGAMHACGGHATHCTDGTCGDMK